MKVTKSSPNMYWSQNTSVSVGYLVQKWLPTHIHSHVIYFYNLIFGHQSVHCTRWWLCCCVAYLNLFISLCPQLRDHKCRTHLFSKRIFNIFPMCSMLDTTALLVMVITVLLVTVSIVSYFKSKLFWNGMCVLILLLAQSVSFFPHFSLEVDSVMIQRLVFIRWQNKMRMISCFCLLRLNQLINAPWMCLFPCSYKLKLL